MAFITITFISAILVGEKFCAIYYLGRTPETSAGHEDLCSRCTLVPQEQKQPFADGKRKD